MGDITQALRTAQSGLLVNQQALNVVSNNISNVNTEGYSKKVLAFDNVSVAGVGAGVKVSDIVRRVDEGLLKSLRIENGELNSLTVKEDFFARMQELFGAPGDNNSISHLTEKLAEAFELLAVSPDKTLEAAEVVRRADDVVTRLRNMSESIQELRLQADNAITDVVSQINKITATIDQLNDDIISNGSVGRDTTDLKDQRDLEIDKLSKLVDIRFFFRSDGDAVIFTEAGRTLVDTVPPVLSHTASATISATSTHAEGDITGIFVGTAISQNDITDEVREGQLKGLIDLRDDILVNLQSQLDEFAAELRDGVNQVHNRGVAYPGAQTYTGTRTFIDASNQTMTLETTNSVDDVTLALFNATGDQTAVTTLNTIMQVNTFGGTAQASRGPWTITEVATHIQGWLRANGASAATAAVSTEGKFTINLNSTSLNLAFRDEEASANGSTASDASISFNANGGAGAGQDTVNDETISGFSNFFGFNDFFVDNQADNIYESKVLASSQLVPANATITFRDATGTLTGSPLSISANTTLTDLATQITNSVTNITASVVPDGSGFRLRISHDQGSSTTITGATGDTFLSTYGIQQADVRISTNLSVRTDIKNAPSSTITTGQPQWNAALGASGEYFMSPGDDTIIQQMAEAFSSNVTFEQSGGLPEVQNTFAQYAAGILANNASLADVNDRNIDSQRTLTETLQFKSDSVRGVNLDEEMADLIVFEQAFAAAARVISVIQQMIEALERAVG